MSDSLGYRTSNEEWRRPHEALPDCTIKKSL
jgi:hypothetical protein